MHILLLGGTGFIGSRLLQALAEHEVTVFHRGTSKATPPRVNHIFGERENIESYRHLFKKLKPDIIIDMIAKNAVDAQLVSKCLVGLSERIVVISSISVYRSFGVMIGSEIGQVDNTPLTEDSPLRSKMFPYKGMTPRPNCATNWLDKYDKILAEQVYLNHSQLNCNVIRLPFVYGPHDPDYRLLFYIKQMLAQKPHIYLQEKVSHWRNARSYVDNAAASIACVAIKGVSGRVYNIADSGDFTEHEWINKIGLQLRWRGRVRTVPNGSLSGYPPINEFPAKTNFSQHLSMNSSRIRNELGYHEIISTDKALHVTIEHTMKDILKIDNPQKDLFV